MNHPFHSTAEAALPCRALPLPQQPWECCCQPCRKPPAFPSPLWITHMLPSTATRRMSSRRGNYLRRGLFRHLLPVPICSMPHQYVIATNQLFGRRCRQSHGCAIPPQIANGGRDFCRWILIGPPKAVLLSPPNRQFIFLFVWYNINQCFKKCLGGSRGVVFLLQVNDDSHCLLTCPAFSLVEKRQIHSLSR